ncbi:MAG: hypothetical protein K2L41_11010 [Muribaculaceae bacterium]|nr:hypothetical protein [Muribaculaceae bacterium]
MPHKAPTASPINKTERNRRLSNIDPIAGNKATKIHIQVSPPAQREAATPMASDNKSGNSGT